MDKLLSGKELKIAIGTLKKDAKGWVARIEHLAQSACVEAAKSGNCTAINLLADATKDIGSRAVMRWLEKHGPVKWDKDEDAFVMSDKKYEKAHADVAAYTAEIAKADSYAKAAKPSDSNPFMFDLNDAIHGLVKRTEGAKAKATEEGATVSIDEATYAKLIELASSLPVKVKATAGTKAPKPKSSKGRTLTAETETVATA